MTTLTNQAVQSIIQRVLHGQEYRTVVLALINAEFLEYVIAFFKQVVAAKLDVEAITVDWYKHNFVINPNLPLADRIIHAGLNHKTVTNMYRSAHRSIVVTVVENHYDELYTFIETLMEQDHELNVTLSIEFRGVKVELTLSETLIVINTLAVKRAQLRGGAWSSAGKRVEKYLMITLCEIFNVPLNHYALTGLSQQNREIDFYLINDDVKYQCEVKLMGKGNPESADAVIARDTHIFIADTLSELNKRQLDGLGIYWVEFFTPEGYRKFFTILSALGIPCTDFTGDLDQRLTEIFSVLFPA